MTSVKTEIAKGAFWIAIAKYSGLLISLCITVILARNIEPSAFGSMAIATVIMAFLDIFTDMGIGPAIVQYKDLTKPQIETLFVLGAGIGLFLSLILFLASTPIAKYYNDLNLIHIIRCLCICLLFNALNIVPNALMLKSKRFRTIALRTLSFQVLCGSVAVYGAINSWGIYSLIVTPIITSVGVFIVNFINYPQKISCHLDYDVIKRIWNYSLFQFLFSLTNYFSRNFDKLIIGKYFSMSQLGYYEKSYRMMQLPLQNITFVISPVLHPILSSLQNNKQELGNKNRRLLTLLSQISFPIGLILYFCAHEVIMIFFGENWTPSIPIFQILALSLPLQMLLSTSGSFFQAAGQTNHMFFSGICNTTVTIIGFLFSAIKFHDITAMAWAWNITLGINFITSYVIMNRITFRYSLRKFFSTFLPQIYNTALTALIAYHLIRWIPIDNLLISMIYKLCVVIILTLFFAYLLKQYNAIAIIHTILSKLKRGEKIQ